MGDVMAAPLRLGDIALDCDRRALTGPRGQIMLRPSMYAVLSRLLLRPGVVVSGSDLITAIYNDPDDEPEHSAVVLRTTVQRLRSLLGALDGSEAIIIRTEIGFGYSIQRRVR